jgi:uncharacterized membrane protein
MAFCSSCGAQVDGRFCPKCGAPQEAPEGAAAAPPQPAYAPPPPAQPVAAGGMEDNMAGALCYLLGFITGVLFLVLEPYNKRPFVRFHAFQAILFSAGWIVLSIAVSILLGLMSVVMHMWLVFVPLRMLIGLLGFLLWLFCMYKAYNRELYQLPIVGPIAARQAGS